MHISDRNRLLDTPGGNPPPRTWHDYRKQSLRQAFAKLKQCRDALKKREADKVIPRLNMQHRRFWMPQVILTPFLVLPALFGKPWVLIGSAICWLVLIAIFDLVRPRLAKRRFRKLAARIRRGDFGHAVMWEGDLVWELLKAALQPYGIELTELFQDQILNTRATPVLSDLLEDTADLRLTMQRAYGGLIPHANASASVLADKVSVAASTIYTIYCNRA